MRLVVVAAVVVGCALLARWAARRRRTRLDLAHQVGRVAAHLGQPAPPSSADRDVRASLSRVARSVDLLVEGAQAHERLGALMAATLEATPLGVVIVDQDGRELFRNASAAALAAGGSADAIAARAVRELLEGARAGDRASTTVELHGPPRRTLRLSGVPLAGRPSSGPAAVLIEDVSERRRLDTVRRDFVANMSHELKTPVGALGLLAETLSTEDDPEVVRRLSGRIQDEAFRVATVIDDLLDLSRLESEEAAARRPVRVGDIVSEAVERVRPAAAARGVEVAVAEVPWDTELLGDRRQLVSALFNLLDNAVKYSEAGCTVEARATQAHGSIDLVVRDQGVGIPARDLDRVFERFYRVDRGRGRDTGGTGLGLAIVRHVAGNHGGEVVVESQEGVGSTFTLRLPAPHPHVSVPAAS